ncbi:haloacid dehalogenase [Brachyspira suanatina]|uniref:Haloacid dehalogenase n=1 Tax=Brachyspira suanatina TaxID=381802 RepID=A0A0G4K463_9SPIR|nr:HAD family phosphatase [Brachyspira suanatina]CRF31881.1 haloacid dehalogenase [Brachyspira suanatina]
MDIIKPKAIIFDFDGTLVNSESIYTKSLIAIANKMDTLKDVDFEAMTGMHTEDIYNNLKDRGYNVPDNFFSETEKYFHKLLETDLNVFDGVMETFERFKNLNMVIASNSNIDYVKKYSDIKGISKYIKGYSCFNEKLRAKPEPDLFLYAFEILKGYNNDLKKDDVIIFEDSLAGIEAAKRSGIKSVGITNSYSKEELIEKGAYIVVDKINEVFNYIEL